MRRKSLLCYDSYRRNKEISSVRVNENDTVNFFQLALWVALVCRKWVQQKHVTCEKLTNIDQTRDLSDCPFTHISKLLQGNTSHTVMHCESTCNQSKFYTRCTVLAFEIVVPECADLSW